MSSPSKQTTDVQKQPTPEETREDLLQLVKDSGTVLLMSHGEDDKIVGRPMGLARVDDDATIYLVTGIDSKKVAELRRVPRVTVAANHAHGTAMIDGSVTVSQDRGLISELWQDSWKPYFPEGKSDPTIAILIVAPHDGVLWPAGAAHGLSFLWRNLKARVTGEPIEIKPTDQQKVDLVSR